MILPHLKPLWYNLPMWYARAHGIRNQINSIHRRGGKDVNDFAMTVQDAIEFGGVHYYLFPTRVWAEEVIFKEQFAVDGVMKSFWEWAIPPGIKAVKRDKDCCIIFPHNGARIQLGGTDDLSFVGRGGRSYTMSEFSLHKNNVTGYIAPILRQSGASFRANGTLRGKNNQLYTMLIDNMHSDDWFCQWLKPQDTKCYCWVSDEFNINPELLPHIGKRGPNGGQIFNVQSDIDSGMISMALARQEYLNDVVSSVVAGYYNYELTALIARGSVCNIKEQDDPVYTAWDLGGKNEDNDTTAIVFFTYNAASGRCCVIDYYENKGHLRGHYIEEVNRRGYNYGGHFFPHDAKRSNAWNGETSADTAYNEYGMDIRFVPKTQKTMNDIEIARRTLANTSFDSLRCELLIEHLGNYHETTTGIPCHKNNCRECNGASHGADAFRYMCMAIHHNLVEPYLQPKVPKHNWLYRPVDEHVVQEDDFIC